MTWAAEWYTGCWCQIEESSSKVRREWHKQPSGILVISAKWKKAQARLGGIDMSSQGAYWSLVPNRGRLERTIKVEGRGPKTMSPISWFLSERMQGQRLTILELKDYNRTGASKYMKWRVCLKQIVGSLEQRTKQWLTRILWGWQRKMNGFKGTNIEKKGIQTIPEAEPHQQSNLNTKGWGFPHCTGWITGWLHSEMDVDDAKEWEENGGGKQED